MSENIKYESGFGASVADLKRGYLEPELSNSPSYKAENYSQRWTEPKGEPLEPEIKYPWMDDDAEFRMKDRKSKGFLTRNFRTDGE